MVDFDGNWKKKIGGKILPMCLLISSSVAVILKSIVPIRKKLENFQKK